MHRSNDISSLLSGLNLPEEQKHYREFTPRRDYTEAAAALPEPSVQITETPGAEEPTPSAEETPPITDQAPVMAQSLRALLEEQANARLAQSNIAKKPVSQRNRPLTIALISTKGGVGKSTLASTLATCLRRPGGQTFLLDLDPQNALRTLHCLRDETPGVSQADSTQNNWRALCQSGFAGTQCLTFGDPTEPQRERFERDLENTPQWLAQQLERMDLDQRHTLLIDTPTGHNVYVKQALSVVDVALVVIRADAGSYASLSKLELQLAALRQQNPSVRCAFIINQVETATPFNRDMTEVLSTRLGNSLLGLVYRDAKLSESPAYESNPLEQRPVTIGCQNIRMLSAALENQLEAILS